MFRASLIAVIVLAVSGCATHAPISKDTSSKLQDKTVVATRAERPRFILFTPAVGAAPALGPIAMAAVGQPTIDNPGLVDPAETISTLLQDRLRTARNTKALTTPALTTTSNAAGIVAANPGGDYVLDVRTVTWMLSYYPLDWGGYRLTYVAKLRLIDATTKSVVAESSCSTTGDEEDPPRLGQFLINDAALLQTYLTKAASYCADTLARNALLI